MTAGNQHGLRLFRRCDPDSGKYRDQPSDEIGRDWLADQLGGEQSRRQRVDGHGRGDAGRRRPLQRHHPKDEGQRAAADAEINAGNPLRGVEAAERRDASGQGPTKISAAAPAPMPTVRKPSALDRRMKGRDQTL